MSAAAFDTLGCKCKLWITLALCSPRRDSGCGTLARSRHQCHKSDVRGREHARSPRRPAAGWRQYSKDDAYADNNPRPRDRRRRRGRLGPLSPDKARLVGRDARRTLRTHLRLHMACRGRFPYAQRRYQHGRAAGLYHPALQGAGRDHRHVLRAASRGRGHAGRQPRPLRHDAGRTRQAPVHGPRHRDRGPRGNREDRPRDQHRRDHRRPLRPARRASGPLGHHPCLCQGRADGWGYHRNSLHGAGNEPAPRRDMGCRHRQGHHPCRACGERRRPLGA